MAPVVHECRSHGDAVEPVVCLTGQHREMLVQATEYFGIRADIDLEVMQISQTLPRLTARCLSELDSVLLDCQPDCVVVQGDTTTAAAAAMVAFYHHIPVVHVEAGLRTGNLLAPWPEEFNRRTADLVASLHCAPTERAAEALRAEGVSPATIHITGNTVVDALLETVQRERINAPMWCRKYAMLGDRPLVLVTGHRREHFGEGMESICHAVLLLAERLSQHEFLYPVHLNPKVREPAHRILGRQSNVHLIEPVPYPEFVWLMDRSVLILSDSGGVQEEAVSLRKPLLVMRETTERPEVVEAGAARLVGTSVHSIVDGAMLLLTDPDQYAACQIDHNPFGDGHAAQRIVSLMMQQEWSPVSPEM